MQSQSPRSELFYMPFQGEVIKPGLDSGLDWNLESLHTRTRSIISMLRRLLFHRVLVANSYRWSQGLLFCRHPNDLVVQHKEQIMFTNPNTGKYTNCHENTDMCTTMPVLVAYAKNFHHLIGILLQCLQKYTKISLLWNLV